MTMRFAGLGWRLGLAACLAFVPAATGDDWLRQEEVPTEEVTRELNALRGRSVPDAAARVDVYRAAREIASEQGRLAAGLLIGVALEQTEQKAAAQAAYEELQARGASTPYATTAAARLRLMGLAPDQREQEYGKLAEEPGAEEASGWFLIGDRWEWSTQRRAALLSLMRLRDSYLSVRVFNSLKEHSPWPPAYAYLFILLVLTLAVRLLMLPLSFRAARTAVRIRRLAPEIQAICEAYAGQPLELSEEMRRLYQRHGINNIGGCLVMLLDLVFVIWALITLSSYAPQIALDDARFLWVDDLTRFSLLLALLCVGAALAVQYISLALVYPSRLAAQMSANSLLSWVVIVGIAWYWQWPAYVFVFWLLLLAVGTAATCVLMPIAALLDPEE